MAKNKVQQIELDPSITADIRVGIFGGSFNPIHMGHINCVSTVQSRMNLDKIVVVPAAQNPLKPELEGPTAHQRLEMAKIGLGEFPFVVVDDREIQRGGASYTIETVKDYASKVPPENLYLIVGLDQFEHFDKWKEFAEILTLANLIVVSRPNHNLPFSEEDLAPGLRNLVAVFDRQFIALTTGRSIEFLRLADVDVSASEVRKRLRTGRNVDRHITIGVEDYIRQNQLYSPLGPRIGDYEAFTKFCAQALFDKKAINVKAFDLRGTDSVAEFTLIASGTSTRHATSLAENVARAVKDEFNVYPQSLEGTGEGRWVVIDYGALIIHVFYDFVRQEYRLEDLWKAGRQMEVQDQAAAKGK